jgi:hypothetical protein
MGISSDIEAGRESATAQAPHYVETLAYEDGDVRLRRRMFTYRDSGAVVAGTVFRVKFALDADPTTVWPYFKDFNRWQDPYNHYYSGVVGDLEGETFRLSDRPDNPGPHYYKVIKVVPEHLIAIYQPVPDDGSSAGIAPGHGSGGVSPGFHVFMLTKSDAGTDVDIQMEHKFRSESLTEDEALECLSWLKDSEHKWRDVFIPSLRHLVAAGALPDGWTDKWRAEHQAVSAEKRYSPDR